MATLSQAVVDNIVRKLMGQLGTAALVTAEAIKYAIESMGGAATGDMTIAVYDPAAKSAQLAAVTDLAIDANLSVAAQAAIAASHSANADTDLDPTFEATFAKLAGATFVGDIGLGAFDLNFTFDKLKQVANGWLGIQNLAGDTRTSLQVGYIEAYSGFRGGGGNEAIESANLDAAALLFKARDTGVGLVTVARLVGAADPYLEATLPIVLLPIATASLPATPVKGMIAYDTTLDKLVVYTGAVWVPWVVASDITATKIDDLTAGDDNTDLDVSTTKHGLAPKAVAPAAGLINVFGIANAETAITNKPLFDATNPANLGVVSPGTATVTARRDHVHAMPSAADVGAATTATKLDDFATPDANTDLNANTTNHGLLLQATAPAAGLTNVVAIENGETTYKNKALFDATVPGDSTTIQAAAAGTAVVTARRDHVHGIAHSIADNAVVTVDDAAVADNDFAIFTANGLEGLPTATILTNLLATVLAEDDAIKLDPALSADNKYCGITETGTAGATIAIGQCCYLASSGKWLLAKADAAATSFGKLGMCLVAGNDTDPTTMLLWGKIREDDLNNTVGAPVFISAATAGALTSTAPTGTTNFVVRIVGYGNTADELFFCPDNTYVELA